MTGKSDVMGAFIQPLEAVFGEPSFRGQSPAEFYEALAEAVSFYSRDVLAHAAKTMIRERREARFPSIAECRAAVADAATRLAPPKADRPGAGMALSRRDALTLMAMDGALVERAEIGLWLVDLDEFVQANGRLPTRAEQQRLEDEARRASAKRRSYLSEGGLVAYTVATFDKAIRARHDKLRRILQETPA